MRQSSDNLRSGSVKDQLKLFWTHSVSPEYRRVSRNVLREVCEFLSLGFTYLASIQYDFLSLYDVATSLPPVVAILPVTLSPGTVFCLLDREMLLAAGGLPAVSAAHLIDWPRKKARTLEAMCRKRACPGIFKGSSAVFLFGSRGAAGTSCEKLHLASKHWLPLSDMTQARFAFSPCGYEDAVFLADVAHSPRVIESFSLATETFRVLALQLPSLEVMNSVAYIVWGELIVLTDSGVRLRGHVRGRGEMSVEPLAGRSNLRSSPCPLLAYQGGLYLLSAFHEEILYIDSASHALQEVRLAIWQTAGLRSPDSAAESKLRK